MPSAVSIAFIAFLLFAGTLGACGPSDPTGYYEGTAQSKEAGTLKVSVNLRCDGGRYGGSIVTPVGTFAITDGSYANGQLNVKFGGGAIGDSGTITLAVNGDKAAGTFQLGADSGTFALTRLGDARAVASNEPDLNISKAQWHDDLRFFTNELLTKHVDPFRFTSRQTLKNDSAALDGRIDRLDPDEIYMQMDHVANLIGDGHTYVEFPPDLALFPIQLHRFGDDYRVVEATGDGAPALGARVIRINGTPVQSVHDRLYDAITPVGETSVLRDARAENFLTIGMALHGIDAIPQRDQAMYTIVNDAGAQTDLVLHALSPSQVESAQWTWVFKQRPLYRQRPKDDFWYTYIAPAKAVYLSFRGYENLASLGPQFIAFVNAGRPQKVIVDLRLNGGGDYKAGLAYLIQPLAKISAINRKGHLFVLVGRNTFSAAMSNAAQFRTMTRALLAGETIGERPNSSQEANEERLPNSHLVLRYSTKSYAFLPGKNNEVVPDKVIVPTWAQFKAGRDPVLEWALSAYGDK